MCGLHIQGRFFLCLKIYFEYQWFDNNSSLWYNEVMKYFFCFYHSCHTQYLFRDIREGFRADASIEKQKQEYHELREETREALHEVETFSPFASGAVDVTFDGGRHMLLSTFLAQKFGEPTDSWKKIDHPKTFWVLAELTQKGYNVNRPETMQGVHIRIDTTGDITLVDDAQKTSQNIKKTAIHISEEEKIPPKETAKTVLEPLEEKYNSSEQGVSHKVVQEDIKDEELSSVFSSNNHVSVFRDGDGNLESVRLFDTVYDASTLPLWTVRADSGRLGVVAPEYGGKVYIVDEVLGHVWEIELEDKKVFGFDGVVALTNKDRAIVRIGQQYFLIQKGKKDPYSFEIHGEEYSSFDDMRFDTDGRIFVALDKSWYVLDEGV